MPKIPEYKSSVGINVGETPQASDIIGQRTHAAVGESMEAVKQAEQAVIEITDFRQTNEAQALFFEGLTGIKEEADRDIGFDSSQYNSKIDKLIGEASKTITGGTARETFSANASQHAIATKHSISNLFRTRELKAGDAATRYTIQNTVANFPAMDDIEQDQSKLTIRKMLDDGVAKGIYYEGDANIMFANFESNAVRSEMNNDIIAYPAETKTELQSREGKYEGITEQERTAGIISCDAYVKKYKQEAKQAEAELYVNNHDDIILRLNDPTREDGAITRTEILSRMASEGEDKIKPAFGTQILANLESTYNKKNKRTSAFIEHAEFALAIGTEDSATVEKNILELLKSQATGKISPEEFNILYAFNKIAGDKDTGLPAQTFLQSCNIFCDYNATARPETRARMFTNYMQKVVAGVAPEIAADEAIKEEVKALHPQATTYQQAGQLVMDAYGVFKLITPLAQILDTAAITTAIGAAAGAITGKFDKEDKSK